MPELPDITAYIDALNVRVSKQRIERIRIAGPFFLRSFDPPVSKAEGKTVLFPHAVAAAEYNSLLVDKLSVGAGPGVSLRHWFREDKYDAPRSYVDFSLQYRFRLSGDDRAKGLFLTSLLSY